MIRLLAILIGAALVAAGIAWIADRQGELGYVVAVRCLGHDEDIGLAGRQIDLFDVDADFLRHLTRGLCALGAILDIADTLVGEVQ